MRICEANTRVLRAMPQPDIDAMRIGRLAPASTHQRIPQTAENRTSMQGAGVRKTSRQRRVGCAFLTVVQRKVCPRLSAQNGMHFPDGLLAESSSRNPRSERDTLSQRRSKRKAHPRTPPQTGTCFPPAASSTPKPMRPPFQNWVEESQNAIAGGQYDCRR